jgi:lysophospholipase L1-like esterase
MNRRIAFHIIAALASTVIGLVGIELFVRLIVDDGMQYDLEMWKYANDLKRISDDPLMGHQHQSSRRAKLMGVDFQTNSKGLRDREIPYAKAPEKLRILMLGDSLTVGWGVAVEDTFPKRVERMYAAKGVDAEVINAGVGNYNTIQEVEYFFTEGHKYRPDVVVLNYFINDAEPVPKHHTPSVLEQACFACVFISGRVDTLARMVKTKQNWGDYYVSLYKDGEATGWLNARESIGRLAEYCRTNGVRLFIANLPELHNVKSYPFQKVTDLVREAANSYGAEFVDLLPYVKDQDSPKLWVAASDPHPNALAHSLIAQGLFKALAGLHPIPQLSGRACDLPDSCP